MAVAQGSKPVKKASAPKKSKASPSHPPYIQMITEALVALKERTGSSHYAIAKHIEEEQKVRDLSTNFKKLLFIQLKKFVASGKLVKVKNSFKLPPAAGKTTPAPAQATEKPKPKAKDGATTKKKVTAKPKTVTVKPKAKAAPAKAKKEKTVQVKSPAKKGVQAKSPAKKVVQAKAKKPKSIKSPVKRAAAMKNAPPAKKAKK